MKKELIEEYKSLTATCARTDYGVKKSVRQHNKAVARMYKIVEKICEDKMKETLNEFYELLNVAENNTNLWAAIHMLERLPFDEKIEEKALDIIRAASQEDTSDALGYQYWLKDWQEKRKK